MMKTANVLKSLRKGTVIRKIMFIFTAAFLLSPVLFSLDPAIQLDQYLSRIWTAEKGLPQNTLTSMVQTRSGYIWIGTPTGLVCFDGVRFRTYFRSNTPFLSHDRISSLYEDDSGILWIGTNGGGLFSLSLNPYGYNYQWKHYTVREGLSNNNIRTMISDWEGNLWVGTDYGLNRISQDGVRIYTTEDGLYDNIITALALDVQGHLWVGTLQGGLAQIQDHAIYTYGPENGLLNPAVLSLASDSSGNIWVGTLEGLYFLKRGSYVLQSISGTSYTPVTSLIWDDFGILWIGTMADGLMQRKRISSSEWILEKRFSGEYIHCLLFDNEGNLWVGTDTEGLIELKYPHVTNITRSQSLPEDAVFSITETHDGFLWAGTRSKGLCKIKDNRVIDIFNRENGLSGNEILTLFEDAQRGLWIGTKGQGLTIIKNGQMTSLSVEEGLRSNTVNAVIQDTKGVMWIGTDKGLNQISGRSMEPKEIKNIPGLEGGFIRALFPGKENTLFIGTNRGLFAYKEGDPLKAIEIGSGSFIPEITSLYEDSTGILWIGTVGSGVRCVSGEKVLSFTTENGLVDDYIYGITEDVSHNIWMSSNRGLIRINRTEFLKFSQGEIDFIHSSFYDECDGMASRQGSSQGHPSLITSSSGQLYCATPKGIAVIDPDSLPVQKQLPSVIIEDVKADERSLLINEERVILPHKPAVLEFLFTAIDFSAPEKISFDYQLEGEDAQIKHILPGEDRSVTYIDSDAGLYRFTVRAINNEGLVSDTIRMIEIEIKSPFYRTKPFLAGVILLALVLIGGGIALRQRKKARRLADKYKTSGIDLGRMDEVTPRLLRLLEEDKLYLDPGLTLKKLAHKLRIHPNHLSRIINERFSLSYNDFVNKYRIAEAQKMLSDPRNKQMNILDIIYETGFYSKSVFNTAFKKFTGKTPSEYRKTQNDR
jgi:ligand-binding sensor domain-containing protein/AraC-like DNA-binding protein